MQVCQTCCLLSALIGRNVCLCSESVCSEYSSPSRFVNSCGLGDSYTTLIPRLAISPDSCDPVESNQRHAVCSSLKASAHHIPASPLSLSLIHSHQDGSTLVTEQSSTSAFGNFIFRSKVGAVTNGSSQLDNISFISARQTARRKPFRMTASGLHSRVMLLLCFVSTAACNTFAFTEEPPERAGKADGYCSRILRAQSNRKEGNNEFRLRVEGDPDSYQPGSTYRGWCL